MREWIEHDGKGIPVGPRDRVTVRFRNYPKETREAPAEWWMGFWDGDDISHYRLSKANGDKDE